MACGSVVLAQPNSVCANTKVVDEGAEQRDVGSGPTIDGLVAVTDGEDVLLRGRKRADDGVLNGVEILEFVDEYRVPAVSQPLRVDRMLNDVRGAQQQHVEVKHVSVAENFLVALETSCITARERIAA